MATKRAPERRQSAMALVALLAVGAATATVIAMVVAHSSSTGPSRGTAQAGGIPHGGSAGVQTGPAAAAALARVQAAGWIVRQVNPSATVACDPGMCSTLKGAGLPAGRLLVLRRSAAERLNADIVVATLAVRGQFGVRLGSEYAPEVIASFGSGPTRIEIRYVAPDGARSFAADLIADRGARAVAGQQLLRNQGIHFSTTARAALAAGSVDSRLLVTLAALAAQRQLSVVAFSDSSPGATDVPLRTVQIGAGPLTTMRAIQSFELAQRPPYLPARARLVRVSGGQYLLTIQFDAPSPLGLSSGL